MRVCAFWRLSLFLFVVLFLASLGLLSFHNALIDARRASLVVQGDAIAALLAADASFEPERMAPLLRRLAPGPRIRARVFARDGLAHYLSRRGVPYEGFSDLTDVAAALR